MVMSRDPKVNFENFLFCPNFTFNIRKALYLRSYQQKTSRGGGTPPSAFTVKRSKLDYIKTPYSVIALRFELPFSQFSLTLDILVLTLLNGGGGGGGEVLSIYKLLFTD